MALRHVALAPVLLLAGCGGDEGSGTIATPAPVATAPSPTPTPSPSPSPSPTPTPSPTPSAPAAATYLTFGEVYTNRVGRELLLSSACSGFALQGQPFEPLPVTAFGRGLALRFVLTPQVWAISGDGVAISFDGRLADITTGTEEVAYREVTPTHVNRYAIERPAAAGAGLIYARVATLATQVGGVGRRYACLTGIPTLPTDLPASTSGGYPRTVVTGQAYAGDGSPATAYTLTSGVTSISTDIAAGRVTIAFTLIATPSAGTGGSIVLGSFAAAAPIDPATGTFVAALTSSDRAVSGTLSGRFFGPQGIEIGAAIGGTVAAANGRPAYSFAGTLLGARM